MRNYFAVVLLVFVNLAYSQDVLRNDLRSDSLSIGHVSGQSIQMDSTATYRLSIDSSNYYVNNLDSIKSDAQRRLDSVSYLYQKLVDPLLLEQTRLGITLDSLKRTNGPIAVMQSKTDSVANKITLITESLTNKIEKIKGETSARLAIKGFPPDIQSTADQFTARLNKVNLDQIKSKVPGITNDLSGIDMHSSLNGKSVLATGTDGLKVPPQIKMTSITGIGDGASQIAGSKANVAEYMPSDGKAIDEIGEANLGKLNEVQALKDQSKNLEMAQLPNQETAKQEIVQLVYNTAIDHFAGKQAELKAAMDQVSKIKVKYADVADIRNLPSRLKNTMNGKPLVDRLVPGISLQFMRGGNNFITDFNPYVGVRVSGRITTGMGWNQRIAYNVKVNYFEPSAHIYGPRLYGEVHIVKGLYPRIEGELMRTKIPPTGTSNDPTLRQWVPGVFAGVKKDYSIMGRLMGTAIVMVRLANRNLKSPYDDLINARIGFEFPLRKNKKTTTNSTTKK